MENVIIKERVTNPNNFLRIISFSWIKKNTIVEIISLLFILLFMYASTNKLIDYQKFRVQLGQSPLLTPFSNLVVWVVPLIEITISIMLVFLRFRRIGLYSSFTMMVIFTAYIIAVTNFSDHVPCSCGGILENMNWNQHLVFNIGFLLLSIVAVFLNSKLEVQSGS